MAQRNLSKFLFSLIFIVAFKRANSQCTTFFNAVSDVTLQCSGGAAGRSAVAFYPTQNKYYSVNNGSASYPIEVFDLTGGPAISTITQAANYNGFWYNFNLGILEGNVFGQNAIIQHSINPLNSYAVGTTSIVAPAAMPSSLSCGQFDPVNNQILYYSGSFLYKYNRTTGALVATVPVTGLPATSINSTSIIYTGIAGSEVGLFDYNIRRVYFVNYTTGVYTSFCQLPPSAPAPTSLGLGYANNRLFLFDNATLRWYGYKVSNKPDIYFFGYNILCDNQAVLINASNPENSISTYTWSISSLFGSNGPVFMTSQPTVSTIYPVTVTSSVGCTNSSNFLMTVYPGPVSTSITVAGNDSLFCVNPGSTTLTASGLNSYTWNTVQYTNTIVVSPTISTIYTVFGKDSKGCRISTSYSVLVYGGPTVTIISSNSLICAGESVILTASGAPNYTWSTNALTSTISVSPTVTTNYTIVGENSIGCKNQWGITVDVGVSPILTVSGKKVLCSGGLTNLYAHGANSYTWSTGAVSSSIPVTPTVTTTYSVFGFGNYDCGTTALVTVTVSTCLGINSVEESETNFTIYPNPTAGIFTLYLSTHSQNSTVTICDPVGKVVYSEKINDSDSEIDITDLSAGIYFLTLTTNKNIAGRKKVVKQ